MNDALEVLAPGMFGRQGAQDHLRAARDDVQRGADLMRNARGELARHGQRLRAPELLLEIEGVLALGGHALPRLLELLRHAIERRGQLPELVVTLDGQRGAPPALAEGADGVSEARQR